MRPASRGNISNTIGRTGEKGWDVTDVERRSGGGLLLGEAAIIVRNAKRGREVSVHWPSPNAKEKEKQKVEMAKRE